MSINEVRYLPECGSTNAYVKEHFEEFGPVAAVYTENQTAGRGRLGRSWVNAEGKALYYTVAIKEPLDGLAGFDQTVVFYTHGHMYGVKYDLDTLADAAAARGAEVALFGHSHIPHAEQRGNVFLFNPGSCGRCYTGPDTYGLLTLENGAVTDYEHKEVPKQ